ncbi:MAG: PIN domain-containing protein [Deltaproteobacteria bacterium]|nr:PIN domain-containing protein [Deltaproteobacteria bacterium]
MIERLFLLDTNIVLTLVRGNVLATFIDSKFGLRASKVRPMISVVTHGEVRVLAGRNDWGEEKLAALQNALNNLVTVDINHPDVLNAYVKIDIYSQIHADGARNMGKNDLWIAACAKAAGATLLTTDKDFDHLNETMLSVKYINPESAKSS